MKTKDLNVLLILIIIFLVSVQFVLVIDNYLDKQTMRNNIINLQKWQIKHDSEEIKLRKIN